MRITCDQNQGPVWRIRLGADGKRDVSLSSRGLTDLLALLRAAEQAPSCRVLTLEGEQGSFCSGMDLDAVVTEPGTYAEFGVSLYAECIKALTHSSRTVVALVDGRVLGGGVGIAAATDLLIATKAATFALPELTFGLVPAMVMPLLLRRMPPQKAQRLALIGSELSAVDAEAIGLVDQVVDSADALQRAARKLIRQLLRADPSAVSRVKQLCRDIAAVTPDRAVELGAECTAAILKQPGNISVLKAFLDGQLPPWFTRGSGGPAH